MKYIKVEWPEIQDYMLYGQMNVIDSQYYIYFDPRKSWFIPDNWEPDDLGLGGDIGDLDDAMG